MPPLLAQGAFVQGAGTRDACPYPCEDARERVPPRWDFASERSAVKSHARWRLGSGPLRRANVMIS